MSVDDIFMDLNDRLEGFTIFLPQFPFNNICCKFLQHLKGKSTSKEISIAFAGCIYNVIFCLEIVESKICTASSEWVIVLGQGLASPLLK